MFDVRRLTLGVSIIGEQLLGCSCTESLIENVASGYTSGLSNVLEPSGVMYRALVDEAQEEGEERKKFYNRTEEVDGVRQFKEDRIKFSAEVLDWGQRNGVRILDVKRHYAGVSSYSALRYLVLWDNGEDGDTDDRMTQLRKLSDAVVYTKRVLFGS